MFTEAKVMGRGKELISGQRWRHFETAEPREAARLCGRDYMDGIGRGGKYMVICRQGDEVFGPFEVVKETRYTVFGPFERE